MESDFPGVCQRICGALIEKAIDETYKQVYKIEEGCEWDDTEYSGTSLQGSPDSTTRYVTEASFCVSHQKDAFREVSLFSCRNTS